MDELERLIALESIRTLKYSYCQLLDAKDWDRFRTLFTPNGSADMREAGPAGAPGMILIEGLDAMMDYVREAVLTLKTIHHVFAPMVTFDGPELAHGVWQMEDLLYQPDRDDWRLMLHGYGHYFETYVKQDYAWKIHAVKLTRSHVEAGN